MELNIKSSSETIASDNKWVDALSDAKTRHDASPRGREKRSWLAVMRVIQANIERGESWPE